MKYIIKYLGILLGLTIITPCWANMSGTGATIYGSVQVKSDLDCKNYKDAQGVSLCKGGLTEDECRSILKKLDGNGTGTSALDEWCCDGNEQSEPKQFDADKLPGSGNNQPCDNISGQNINENAGTGDFDVTLNKGASSNQNDCKGDPCADDSCSESCGEETIFDEFLAEPLEY